MRCEKRPPIGASRMSGDSVTCSAKDRRAPAFCRASRSRRACRQARRRGRTAQQNAVARVANRRKRSSGRAHIPEAARRCDHGYGNLVQARELPELVGLRHRIEDATPKLQNSVILGHSSSPVLGGDTSWSERVIKVSVILRQSRHGAHLTVPHPAPWRFHNRKL